MVIYCPLSTASGSYTLWIYYHRLTDQTLFQCVNDFVKPKLEEVNRDIERERGELQRADGGSSKQRETLEELEDLAIAHGLEHLCEVKAPEKKAKRGKKKTEAELGLAEG